MKRLAGMIAALLSVILVSAFPATAGAAAVLPAEIGGFFDKASFDGSTVLSAANGIGIGGRDACYAVLIRTAKNENVLYMFKQDQSGTAWEYSFSTASAVPQTSHTMDVSIEMSGNEWPTDEYFDTPHLSIVQYDPGDEYPEVCVTFELSHGEWLLHRIWSYTVYQSMLIRDGSISYYRDIESDQIIGTAKGEFQRDLGCVSLSAVPKTLAEARAKLTVAPDLPASNELHTHPVTFPDNKRYDVYSAPDKTSLRGAGGKAKVSTNGSIQVFGTEDDWVLIRYPIDASHHRFGCIRSTALPRKANVPALSFQPVDAWTSTAVSLTDDPLFSRSVLLSLPEGAHVSYLAALGEWAYVEVNSTDRARGFVPLSAVAASREFDMNDNPGENGEVIYDGAVTLYPGDWVELGLTIAEDGPLAGREISRIRVADTFGGSLLALLSPDPYGTFYGNFSLGGDVTSITLTAVDEGGSAYPQTVSVEW